MEIKIKVEGVAEVIKSLERAARAFPEATGQALYEEGLGVQGLAVQRTPVDTGRLRASAYTAPPKTTSSGPEVEVGYGAIYGVYVHERTELRHTTGQAKFLESALNERSSGYAERLGDRIAELAEPKVEK